MIVIKWLVSLMENKEEVIEKKEELATSLTSQIEAIENGEVKEVVKEKSKWTTEKTVKLLLGAFSCLLLIALYFFYFPPKAKPVEVNPEEIEEIVSTPLPSELTDLNSPTLIVNKNYPLPAEYEPSSLVTPYVYSTSEVILVNEIAAEDLKEMFEDAKEANITLYLNSGYISYATQEDLYADRASLVGESEANKSFPKAGFSEHQTGLAFDFTDDPASPSNSESFVDTKAGKWLKENAYKYGFILRYPKDKEHVTGYIYMPWHYRYVGKKAAKEINDLSTETSQDITMEEFYELGKAN